MTFNGKNKASHLVSEHPELQGMRGYWFKNTVKNVFKDGCPLKMDDK